MKRFAGTFLNMVSLGMSSTPHACFLEMTSKEFDTGRASDFLFPAWSQEIFAEVRWDISVHRFSWRVL